MTTSCNDLVTQLKFLGIEHTDRTIRHLGGNRKVARFYPPRFPELQFLLGSLAMRHGQNQKYIQTGSALLALPRKVRKKMKDELTHHGLLTEIACRRRGRLRL